jgi:tetratricopeptide (TPR) repeat protein
MGEAALAAGDAPRALDAFREAWRLEEPLAIDCIAGHTDAYFLDALGRASLAAGNPGDALQSFERIRALGMKGLLQPEIAVMAGYRSGRALEALGRRGEAAARYRQFLGQWGAASPAPPEVGDARTRLGRD